MMEISFGMIWSARATMIGLRMRNMQSCGNVFSNGTCCNTKMAL